MININLEEKIKQKILRLYQENLENICGNIRF
jgi:hypothetical protein